jgi:hypothetical protein
VLACLPRISHLLWTLEFVKRGSKLVNETDGAPGIQTGCFNRLRTSETTVKFTVVVAFQLP